MAAKEAQPKLTLEEKRAKVRTAKSFLSKIVTVDEWDISFEIRSLSLVGKTALVGEQGDVDSIDIAKVYPELVINTVFDPDSGEQFFSEDDISWLQQQPAGIIEYLGNAGLEISGLLSTSVESGKDVS